MMSCYSTSCRPVLKNRLKIKERHCIKLCDIYHEIKLKKSKTIKSNNLERLEEKCLNLCIKKSIEFEKLENEEKSF